MNIVRHLAFLVLLEDAHKRLQPLHLELVVNRGEESSERDLLHKTGDEQTRIRPDQVTLELALRVKYKK